MDQSSARITNAPFSTEKISSQVDLNVKRNSRETRGRRTICQIFRDSVGLAHVVDAAMGRVVLGLPIPVMEKVIADPLFLEIEACTSALCEREGKSGKERMARTHNQTRWEKRDRMRVGYSV